MWNTPDAQILAQQIPCLYETEGVPLKDKLIYLHFFLFGCDWYIAEYDPDKRLFFGYAILNEDFQNAEWGIISFNELESLNYNGFEVECDEHWTPRPAGEVPNIKI
jgi:hypothetical protein